MKNEQTNISIDQLKLLSNALRVKIVTLLSTEELTAKQVADRLSLSPGSIHYHVQKLYDGGLIEIVKTNTINGIVEKYYRSIAKGKWFNSSDTGATDPLLDNDQNSDDVTKLFLRLLLTLEEKTQLVEEMKQVLEKWINRTSINKSANRVEYAVGMKLVSSVKKKEKKENG
jgi:DNA-binding transcriptional ArsR family regulator